MLGIVVAEIVLLTSTIVYASDQVVQQQWWQMLLQYGLETVVAVVVPVLSYLVFKLLNKWHININLDAIDKVVTQGIGYAEQKAANALKVGSPLSSSAEKMKIAVEISNELINKFGLKKMAEDELKKIIEAKLGENK